ncbi:hypothetical protein [Leptospira weilii]|uniref:Uncharacterized protein n=1 Tax=Leptospira weilii str. UI 13098 TaxID=1088542 RepID=M6Q214_9LEPT|nr:hypothetical protein [Leptospira weilii]EMN89556.1 hypothetical protein LEP1GSC108_3633 [Leptospira weilii str. UI 13098]OMI16453.1 hypothetical protein BUQ74_15155 [Leptospira weilii serovar Heyan]
MDEILKYLPLLSPLSVFLWFLIRREVNAQILRFRDEQRKYADSKIKETKDECKEIRAQVLKTREEEREYTELKIKEAKEEYRNLLFQERSKTDRLGDRMMELEKTHTMEIALLRQTASTTDKRLDMIETRIEKLDTKFDEKFDEQKELLHKIHSKFQNGGISK